MLIVSWNRLLVHIVLALSIFSLVLLSVLSEWLGGL